MFNSEITQGKDAGVSPVIGVILMVAITVILAAVIGTFVLDLAGNVQQNAQAAVTFDEGDTSVDVQVTSMQNADTVDISNVSGDASVASEDAFPDPASVGDTATVSGSAGDSGTITVTATLDGNETVIQSHDYDFPA